MTLCDMLAEDLNAEAVPLLTRHAPQCAVSLVSLSYGEPISNSDHHRNLNKRGQRIAPLTWVASDVRVSTNKQCAEGDV
jgi:hypothetical protein